MPDVEVMELCGKFKIVGLCINGNEAPEFSS